MSYNGTIHVIDKSGWSKTYPIEKALTMIGSASFNDVVLNEERGTGVAGVHIQLVSTQTGKNGFRMVNLVNEPILLTLSNARGAIEVSGKGSRGLDDGDAIQLGDFLLTFYLQAAKGFSVEKRSQNIGMALEMPGLSLKDGKKLTGLLTLKNYGQEGRCQFEVDLDGLPADCYQIDPAPLLYPGGEEKLELRFFHQNVRPPAGECPIQIKISAVGAYPTEEVILPLVLDVESVYRFSVDITEDLVNVEDGFSEILLKPMKPAVVNIIQDTTPPLGKNISNSQFGEKDPPSEVTHPNGGQTIPEPAFVENAEKVEDDVDWWADNKPVQKNVNNDPFADLKRGKPKLGVQKSK
ncbi:MAG TPA: hypothetical protein VK856_00305, partial [Anaerolineaceae bacterium]|nr:hypothetical protein [Anaerolineaceae bacterium]